MLYECEEFQPPNAAMPEIHCFDSQRQRRQFRLDTQKWAHLDGQHVDCQRPPQTPEVPKGP